MSERYYAAGFGARFFANFFDYLILTIPIGGLLFIVTGEFSTDWTNGWTWSILYGLYGVILPVQWRGYIIGKKLMSIRITKMNGEPLTYLDMLLREILGKSILTYISFGIIPIISAFMVIFREDKRAIHDLIAKTYVARD